jgi:hypothetical protein
VPLVRSFLLLLVMCGLSAGTGAQAASAARPCVAADEGMFDTGGLRAPILARVWPARVLRLDESSWYETGSTRSADRWRLGSDVPDQSMRVSRCRDGRGKVELDLPDVRRGFPDLARDERVAGLSVTGRSVAWRTWHPRRPGRVFVARFRGRRLGRVRSVAVPRLARRDALDPRIVVTGSGTVLWTLRSSPRADRTWRWAPGRRPDVLVRTAPRGGDLYLFDDAHVLMDDATSSQAKLVPFAEGRAGACSSRGGDEPGAPTRLLGLGGWCVRSTPEPTEPDGTTSGEMSEQHWVYDPAEHRVLATFSSYGYGDQYSSTCSCLHRLARHGSVVVAEHSFTDTRTGDPAQTLRTIVVDTSVDPPRTFSARGAIVADGEAPPQRVPEGPPGQQSPVPSVASVVVPDGALAWIEEQKGGAGRAVWLRDADGTRVVGELTPGDGGLTLDGSTLTWTAPAGPVTLAVRPEDGVAHALWAR